MLTKYIMDYKYKYLKYYKKYLNLIDSNFEQTHGGSGEFTNTTKLFIIYQGIGEQNKKALIERKRILLDDPELHFNDPRKGGHVTLLDITFNSEHRLFGNIIANQDTLAGQIRTAFDNYLHNVKIIHDRNNYNLMGPFWGKNYRLNDNGHSQLKRFRNSVYGYIGAALGQRLVRIDSKNNNEGKLYIYYGIQGDTIENSLYCIPIYHTGDNWVGHISVVNLKRDLSPKVHRSYPNLNSYIQQSNGAQVTSILNTYITTNFTTPIMYLGRTEYNPQGDPRGGIMPWNDITFKRGMRDLKITITRPTTGTRRYWEKIV